LNFKFNQFDLIDHVVFYLIHIDHVFQFSYMVDM